MGDSLMLAYYRGKNRVAVRKVNALSEEEFQLRWTRFSIALARSKRR